MRMKLLIAALAALIVTGVAGAAGDLPLRLVSETSTTITLGWDVQAGTNSYSFWVNGQRVSNSQNGSQNSVRFGKVSPCATPCYVVVANTELARGGYPAAGPPPPTDVCPNIDGVQTTIPPGMIKDANGNCVPAPPPSGNNLILPVNTTWRCTSNVNYDLVKVQITQTTTRQDAVFFSSGCTGHIGRLEVDTWASDSIHIGPNAHDLTIDGGYTARHGICSGCGDLHLDGIQVLGGQRITFRNFSVSIVTAEHSNSALYINCGQSCQQRPTDIVFENSTFRRSPTRNRTVRIGNSLRSGIRNSTVYYCGTGSTCDAPNAGGIVVMDSATDPVNENNTLVAIGG